MQVQSQMLGGAEGIEALPGTLAFACSAVHFVAP